MKKTLICMIVSMAAVVSLAGTYYVSPSGDDGNPGTAPEKPWLTLRRGASALRSGDTLIVGEGFYRQAPFTLNGAPEKGEDISKPVIIRAARPHAAVIHGDIPLPGFAKEPGYRFVSRRATSENILSVVESDTDIVYQPVPSLAESEEVIASYYYDASAKMLYVHTTDGNPPDQHALRGLVAGSGASFKPLPATNEPSRTILLEGLVFKGFDFMALDLRYARNLTVRNCVFYHNRFGVYIAVFARNIRVENCLLFSNNITEPGSPEMAPMVVSGDVAEIVVDGNIVRYNRFNSIRAYSHKIPPGSSVVFSNNRCYGQAPFWFKPNSPGGRMIGNVSEGRARAYEASRNTITALMEPPHSGDDNLIFGGDQESKDAARFADPVNGDYRLQSDSPFRGKGKDGGDLGALPYKGDVFFVRPDGNDAAAGTSVASAWKSLAQSAARLRPGDTLYVMAGTYAGPVRLAQKATAPSPVCLKRRGNDSVVIQGAGAGLVLEGAEHVRIEGVEIRGLKGPGVKAANCSAIQLEECLIHGNQSGVELQDCAGIALKHNTIVRNERGVTAKSARGPIELLSNILQDNAGAQLVLADEMTATNYYGNYNCFWAAGSGALAEAPGTNDPPLARIGERPQSLVADARFEKPGSGDFRLAVGSPCRGRGELERTIGRNDLVPAVPEQPEIDDVRVHHAGGTTATLTYWTPKNPSCAVVEYGCGNSATGRVAMTTDRRIFHVVTLVDLKPGADYWFRPGARYHPESWIDRARRAAAQGSWGEAGSASDAEVFGERRSFRTLPADPPGRRLYVRHDGDDARDGLTPGTAWRSLRQAARGARAGDTVLVGPGRYYETLAPYNSGVSASARIIFRSEEPRAAVLDGKDFCLPYACKLIGRNYITLDGFRFQHQGAVDYDMSGVAPWSAQVFISHASACEVRNCYFYGGAEFPSERWTAIMGLRLNHAGGAVIEDNFFFKETWSVWSSTGSAATGSVAQARYAPPLIKNNTFFIQYIHAFHITGAESLKLRNNLFAEYVRAKAWSPYFNFWYPWEVALDSDYNFFWWHCDKQGQDARMRRIGNWCEPGKKRIELPGGLAPWQKATGQDGHSLEAFFPTDNLYDQLDFTAAGKPYQGRGENGADIGCSWIGKHTDKVVFGDPKSKVDVPPWQGAPGAAGAP